MIWLIFTYSWENCCEIQNLISILVGDLEVMSELHQMEKEHTHLENRFKKIIMQYFSFSLEAWLDHGCNRINNYLLNKGTYYLTILGILNIFSHLTFKIYAISSILQIRTLRFYKFKWLVLSIHCLWVP